MLVRNTAKKMGKIKKKRERHEVCRVEWLGTLREQMGQMQKKKKAKLELCRMTWRTGSQSHKTDEKGKKEKYLVTKKRKNSHVRCAE